VTEYYERHFSTSSTPLSSSPSTRGASSTTKARNIFVVLTVLTTTIFIILVAVLSVDIAGVWRRRTSPRGADSTSKFRRLLGPVSSFSADKSSADDDRCETAGKLSTVVVIVRLSSRKSLEMGEGKLEEGRGA